MERQIIEVQYPVIDHQEAIANIGIVKHEIKNKMINIKEAFWTKNNSLFILIDNQKEQSELIVKAGDVYPNSMLGDISIQLPSGTSAIQLQDLSRFEKADGSLDLNFKEDFEGTIYAIAKPVGFRQ